MPAVPVVAQGMVVGLGKPGDPRLLTPGEASVPTPCTLETGLEDYHRLASSEKWLLLVCVGSGLCDIAEL